MSYCVLAFQGSVVEDISKVLKYESLKIVADLCSHGYCKYKPN